MLTHQPESHTPDFDVEVETAWDEFESRLSTYICAMRPGHELMISSVLGTADDESELPACIRLIHLGDDVVRGEIPPSRLMHYVRTYFLEEFHLLLELGWSEPTRCSHQGPGPGSWHHLDLPQSESDALAAKVVSAFRTFWSVVHPSFLTAVHGGNPASHKFDAYPHTPAADGVEHVSELQSDVHDALESLFGERPLKDEDGDVRLAFEHGCSYIRVHEQTVQIVALIPGEMNTSARTGAEMGALDRRWPTIKFLIQDDYFVAESRVDCSPFSTEHMLRAVCTFQSFLASVDEDFVDNMNGAGDSSEPMPPELLTLLYLDPDSTGTLDDSEVAQICHDDRDLILELIRQCSVQELEWQSSIENAAEDDDDLPVFVAETTTWKQHKDRLVGALRFVVLEKRHR